MGLFTCLLLLISACTHISAQQVKLSAPIKLTVGEGFVNPIGYYEQVPRFSWQIAADANSQLQQAYQIQVASSLARLANADADLWDSQKQLSSATSWIKYQGKALSSRQQIFWRVRIWDEQAQISKWSEAASIELGLLANEDWQGQWIRHPETGEMQAFDHKNKQFKNKLYRPQYLTTQFIATNKTSDKKSTAEIKQARLYITAKGVFNAYINGQKVSEDVMPPGWTPYLQRIETLTYDVTALLNEGENVLAATVAEGWYTGRILWPVPREVKPSALLAQLEIQYTDGSRQTVVTDRNWQVTVNGPIRAAGNYDGETYDANYEMPGWNKLGFNHDESWKPVISEALEPQVVLAPKRHHASAVKLTLPAISIVDVANPEPGVVVFDMGQNMLGVPELNIPVLANQKVKIRFAEALQKNTFYTKNMRSAIATDYYTPAQSGVINYVPTFTFHGYRFVEISGFDQSKTPDLSWLKGRVLHSNFDVNANFKSSHAKLNKLAENVVWGLRGNFLDIPTDCPQRDERLGWTGDAQVFAAPSMYMADVYGFWAAWLQTVREEQADDGRIPNFIPTKESKHGRGSSSGWGDAAVIIPWELYLLTGDAQILKENYDMMQKWLAFHQEKVKDDLSTMGGFADWLQPHPKAKEGSQARRGDTSIELISTAYYAHSLDYIAKAAQVLGRDADAASYTASFNRAKVAFRKAYYDEQTKVIGAASQTSYLLPLAFGLFDGVDVTNAQQHLLATIASADHHLRTGFLGTPLLAPVLQDMGRSDVMYDLLFKETYPSWFYSINNGATTTWERWNSYSLKDGFSKASMNSLNHYAYGAVAKWFYEGILGIKSAGVGFNEINIEPQFNQRLTQASGSYKTPQGEVAVEWSIAQGQLDMQVTIPKNTLANFILPQVQAGTLIINGESVSNQKDAIDKGLTKNMLIKQAPGAYRITGRISL
ncbi:rhamnosidase [Catenovulum maritimum]|uniref:alpha-L-rhamnosidase n=1 Tax=Catenovulum maritimum TaxID=1513271 RepID=A0A0J8GQN0_9ALTE|nr:rhamnosidase [Catenovulum maritimum]